jgi:hypothetical protein
MVNFNVYIHVVGVPSTGVCTLDFDFDLSSRFWVGMAHSGGYVSCSILGTDTLLCARYSTAGNLSDGDIMVLVY